MSQPQARHLVEEEEEAAKLAGHARWLVAGAGAGQMVGAGTRASRSQSTNRPSEAQSSRRHLSHFNRVSDKRKAGKQPASHLPFSSDERGVEGMLAPENIAA